MEPAKCEAESDEKALPVKSEIPATTPPLTLKGWIGALMGLCMFGGLLLVCFQAYMYLRDGFWTPAPAIKLFENVEWVTNPQSWYGVHKIVYWLLNFFSFPVLLFLCGFGGTMALDD